MYTASGNKLCYMGMWNFSHNCLALAESGDTTISTQAVGLLWWFSCPSYLHLQAAKQHNIIMAPIRLKEREKIFFFPDSQSLPRFKSSLMHFLPLTTQGCIYCSPFFPLSTIVITSRSCKAFTCSPLLKHWHLSSCLCWTPLRSKGSGRLKLLLA